MLVLPETDVIICGQIHDSLLCFGTVRGNEGVFESVTLTLIKGIDERIFVPTAMGGCCSEVDYIVSDGAGTLGETKKNQSGLVLKIGWIKNKFMSELIFLNVVQQLAFRDSLVPFC